MDNLNDINYTFLLELDWYDIDKDKTNILKILRIFKSESNIYTFDNIDDFKKLENKNKFVLKKQIQPKIYFNK